MKTKKTCPTCKVALTPTTIGSSLIVKNLIENAYVYCFTRLEALEAGNTSTSSAVTDEDADDDDEVDDAAGKKRSRAVPAGSGSSSSNSSSSSSSSGSSSSGTAAAKRAKSDHCMWTGKLQDARRHFNTCVYAGALCGFGCGAVIRRIDMTEHETSICPKRNVKCSNVGCTAVMPEPLLAAHKANVCLYEVVDCPFSSVGCNEQMLRKDIESHEEAAMKQHNRLLLQGMQSLQQDNLTFRQEIFSSRQENLSFRQDILSLQQDNLSLQRKVAKHGESLDGLAHQIVFKVKVADLVRDDVDLYSDRKVFGACRVHLNVDRDPDNTRHQVLRVYLFTADGPFPCRVIYTLEVVHWNGKSQSAYKQQKTFTYKNGMGIGINIPLNMLTAAESPYVQNCDVIFIATINILPLV